MRYAAKKDAAHAEIVAGLEAHGIVVFDVSSIGSLGFDVICYRPAIRLDPTTHDMEWHAHPLWQVFEIKTPVVSRAREGARKYNRANRPVKASAPLTESEVKAKARAPIPTVSYLQEALSYF